ncbi:ABC transporter substrate-binding protein [Paenibacillus agaridevorans]|uniref:ABC transporter substrate-binding protein n=1 Tax=Paenibacillus agaridevorans TaxID=171404 RepID=UPI00215A08E7|nr:sugar ABC transporter substrate-binding protein [Paenibacillus agaridevorans]
MKKRSGLWMMMLALVLVFTACSSGGGGSKNTPSTSPSSAPSSGTESAAPSEKPPKQLSLTIGLPGSYEVTKKEIIDKFIETHPHITVKIEDAPWGDFTSKIATQIAGNTMPDVWFQENAAILGYGKRGVAEDLKPYIERDLNASDYVDALFSAQTSDGKVWGIPHGVNSVALAYNKSVFEAANVDLPTDDWTYADLIEAAKKLTIKEGNNVKQFGFIGTASITTGWFPWIKQAGGMVLDDTKTKSMLNDPKTLEGLSQLRQGIQDGYFTNNDFLTANGGALEVFATGKSAMYMMQYSEQVSMNSKFPDADWDVVKAPKAVDGKRYVPFVTNSWLISSRASDDSKEAAWQFLKFYLGEEAQTILAESGSSLPVKQSAYTVFDNSTTKPLNKKGFTEGVAEGGVTLDENASWAEWRLLVQQEVNEAIVQGNKSVEDALAAAHKGVQQVLDENK